MRRRRRRWRRLFLRCASLVCRCGVSRQAAPVAAGVDVVRVHGRQLTRVADVHAVGDVRATFWSGVNDSLLDEDLLVRGLLHRGHVRVYGADRFRVAVFPALHALAQNFILDFPP